MSRPIFVGHYLQVTWWAVGQWKGRKNCIEWQSLLSQIRIKCFNMFTVLIAWHLHHLVWEVHQIVLSNLIFETVSMKNSERWFIIGKKKKEKEWKKQNKNKQKQKQNKTESSLTISNGLWMIAYSQVLSHYCLTWKLLPAVFPPWTGLLLFNQPGELRLLCVHHIDTKLSADTRST